MGLSLSKKKITGWIRHNLFRSPLNCAITLGFTIFFIETVPDLLSWAVFKASWTGLSRDDCNSGGACWVFVSSHLQQFAFGFYPEAMRWRPTLAFLLLPFFLILYLLPSSVFRRILTVWVLAGYPVLAGLLIYGTGGVLPVVETRLWGGVLLTMVITLSAIVTTLPAGVILALGRRSQMPVVRGFCTMFIELWRGVPLITVLFMGSVMVPLLLPGELAVNKLLRALLAVILFSSAYMAEVIRGGLQALPSGQYEAGQALGPGYWRLHILVILPQALRAVIPGIVNTFISLFKDTTLVTTIGMFDLLGMIQASSSHPDWLGFALEGYLFAALFFWSLCLLLSRLSLALEARLRQE